MSMLFPPSWSGDRFSAREEREHEAEQEREEQAERDQRADESDEMYNDLAARQRDAELARQPFGHVDYQRELTDPFGY